MCQTAVGLMKKALPSVDNAENLLKIKNLIALFMQTMDVSLRVSTIRDSTNVFLSRLGASQLGHSTGFY